MDQVKAREMTTVRVKDYVYFLIAAVCAVAFFIHELIPGQTANYTNAKYKHIIAKEKRTEALENLKNAASNLPEYNLYLKEKIATDKAWEELNEVKDKDKFLGFTNIQQFLGEFGWALGLFIYSLFNLSLGFLKKEFKGVQYLHITLLSISIFYLSYTIQPLQDFTKIQYYLASVLITSFIVLSAYLLVKKKNERVFKLQKIIDSLSRFAIIKVRDFISRDKIEEYNKEYLKALQKGKE